MIQGATAWQPLLIAGALAALTLWLNHATTIAVMKNNDGFSHVPDYFIDNFQATAFDAQGMPLHVLEAKHMVHYMDDDTTHLTEPHYERQRPDRPTVHARSLRGVVSSNGDHVHFLDRVRVTREASDERPLKMHTEYLHIIPDADVMQTNKPLVITQGSSNMSATGMYADGKSRVITFQGRVKGTYEIKH